MHDTPAILQGLAVIFSAVFTENILLTRFLGMCPFVAVSRQVKTAVGLGGAVLFVLTLTAALNWLLYCCVLVPLGLEYLRFIMFIILIAAFVQLVEMVLERFSPTLYQKLGIFLPLITVNCAILGGSLFIVIDQSNLVADLGWRAAFWRGLGPAVLFGFGSGLGWMLAILAMAGIRQNMKTDRIPRGLQGPGIALIIVGLMSLAFMGFAGVLTR